MEILTSIILGISAVICTYLVVSYLKQSAEIRLSIEELKVQKAQIYTNGQIQSARVESGAWNSVPDDSDGGLMSQLGSITEIVKFAKDNPELLGKFLGKK